MKREDGRYTSTAQGEHAAEHAAERAMWEPIVQAGGVECRRGVDCLEHPDVRIKPGQPWQLGHPDLVCLAPTAPEHRRCNLATATHKAKARIRPAEPHPGRIRHAGGGDPPPPGSAS